jgi:hypothetical protein
MRSIMQAGTVILAGAANTYILATSGAWIWMTLFGILLPIVGLVDWLFTRKREAPMAADRIINYLLAGQIAIFALASRPFWSEARTDRPVPETVRGEAR